MIVARPLVKRGVFGEVANSRQCLAGWLPAGQAHLPQQEVWAPRASCGCRSQEQQAVSKLCQLVAGQDAEERLEHDRRFMQAGVQVIVENFQAYPLFLHGQRGAFGDLFHQAACFSMQVGDNLFDRCQFAEKPRPRAQDEKGIQIIGARDLLRARARKQSGRSGATFGNVPNWQPCP